MAQDETNDKRAMDGVDQQADHSNRPNPSIAGSGQTLVRNASGSIADLVVARLCLVIIASTSYRDIINNAAIKTIILNLVEYTVHLILQVIPDEGHCVQILQDSEKLLSVVLKVTYRWFPEEPELPSIIARTGGRDVGDYIILDWLNPPIIHGVVRLLYGLAYSYMDGNSHDFMNIFVRRVTQLRRDLRMGYFNPNEESVEQILSSDESSMECDSTEDEDE